MVWVLFVKKFPLLDFFDKRLSPLLRFFPGGLLPLIFIGWVFSGKRFTPLVRVVIGFEPKQNIPVWIPLEMLLMLCSDNDASCIW